MSTTSTDLERQVLQPNRPGADPVQVLELVIANIPLLTPSAAALRLVCRSTKAAVDQKITDLSLPIYEPAAAVRVMDNPLLSGLTSLKLSEGYEEEMSGLSVSNACLVALNNSATLEDMHCPGEDFGLEDSGARVVLAMLGSSDWPRLRKLRLCALPSAFESFISIDDMPRLTDLVVDGELSNADLDALRHSASFTANVQVFVLAAPEYVDDDINLSTGLKNLLEATSRLRHLELVNISGICPDLGFLDSVVLPALEFLKLHEIPGGASLAPITATPRPRLQTLDLSGWGGDRDDLEALFSDGSGSLPVLKRMSLHFTCDDWSCLRQIGLTTLTGLNLWLQRIRIADIVHVAAALARLPDLESLDFMVDAARRDQRINFQNGAAMRSLLSVASLPHLRRLHTCWEWESNDEELKCVVEFADTMPLLEELTMMRGRYSYNGLALLAAAGREGRWPRLKSIMIWTYVASEDKDTTQLCRDMLSEVWPDLKFTAFHKSKRRQD